MIAERVPPPAAICLFIIAGERKKEGRVDHGDRTNGKEEIVNVLATAFPFCMQPVKNFLSPFFMEWNTG